MLVTRSGALLMTSKSVSLLDVELDFLRGKGHTQLSLSVLDQHCN